MFDMGSLTYIIEVDDKGALKTINSFDKKMAGATKSTAGFGKMASSVGKIFKGAVVTAIVAGVAKIAKSLVMAASDAEETQNKFDVTFSTVSNKADKMAKDLAKSYGLSRKASKQLLSDTGDLLSGFGFTQEKALDLSGEVNKLAVDLASFTNYSGGASGASAALTKALLGETESLKSLGIAISQADIKQLAEDKGIVGELDRETKAMLTFELAVSQSKNAIGDFSRSQTGFANQSRIAQANIDDLKVALGDGLLPMANLGVTLFNDMAGELVGAADSIKEFMSSADGAEKISKAFGIIAGVFQTVKTLGAGLFKDVFEGLKNLFEPLVVISKEGKGLSISMKIVATVFQLLGAAIQVMTTWVGGLISVFIAYGNVLISVGKIAGNAIALLFDPLNKEKQAKFEASKQGFVKSLVGIKDAVVNTFTETGKAVIEEGKKIIATNKSVSDGLEKDFKEHSEKTAQMSYDALVAKQDALEKGADKEKEINDEKNEDLVKADEAAAAKRIATLQKIADSTEKYAGQSMDFLTSLNEIKDNVDAAEMDKKERSLEMQKQVWDSEAEAKKTGLDESVLGTEEYNKQMDAIDEENKKKQLDADYELQMAKYNQEVDAFKRSQALAIAQIWINQAVATMRGFAEMGWIGGLIVAAATSTIAIAQTAAVATQPPPVAPIKPKFADGGIVNNPGAGVSATVGEMGPEAILPLNDQTLSMLGSAIADAHSASTTKTGSLGGQVINLIIEGMGKATIRLTQDALNNSTIRVPATALV